MKAAWFAAALSAASLAGVSAHAQDAGVFDKWLSQEAPECVPVSAFGSVSTVTDLTPEQFQFVRAFYVALPPVSRTLPPGDHAVMASADGAVMLALVADGQACARFLAPDFLQAMLVQVGHGQSDPHRNAGELAAVARLINGFARSSRRDRRRCVFGGGRGWRSNPQAHRNRRPSAQKSRSGG